MLNLISAEWRKVLPHKGTWMLVWIYPIIFLIVLTIAIFAEGKNPDAMTASGWIDDTTMIWYVPTISLGRYFIAAYFALLIAGEYGWNTWKLVVPHAARWKLMASKFVVAIALLYIAWIGTALLSIVMQYLRTAIVGAVTPDGVTFTSLLAGHWEMLLKGVAPMLIAAGYASLAAVATRSTMASVIISIVLLTFDELFGRLVVWFSGFVEWPALIYRVLPGYHLDNFASWMQAGHGLKVPLASGTVIEYSLAVSEVALVAWVVGLLGGAVLLFRRQDIN